MFDEVEEPDEFEENSEAVMLTKILNTRSVGDVAEIETIIGRLEILDLAQDRRFPKGTRRVRKMIHSSETGRWNEKDEVELHDTISELCTPIDAESLTEVKEYIEFLMLK